jgi:FkbM family methyltransferase
MVTFAGTIRTFANTKFPTFIIALRFFHKSGYVTFKNGSKFKLTWSDFLMLRDTYPYWSKFNLEQMNNGLFKLRQGKFEFTGDLKLICSIVVLTEKYHFTIEPKGEGMFSLSGQSFTLVGSSELVFVSKEMLSGIYDCDCRGKTILDIGGFEGETAVYFSSLGAKKVILYEPIPAHFKTAKQNIERNAINAGLHNEGIAEKDGTLIIEFLSDKVECVVKNVTSVILQSGADIAKIDCEGAEKSLVGVPNEILRRIPLYIIELHSHSIREKVLAKFNDAGFVLSKDNNWSTNLSVVHLKRQQ